MEVINTGMALKPLKERLRMALKWVHVDDDIPENGWVDSKKHGEYFYSDWMLVRKRNGDIFLWRRVLTPTSEEWKWKGNEHINKSITHWRLVLDVENYEDFLKEIT